MNNLLTSPMLPLFAQDDAAAAGAMLGTMCCVLVIALLPAVIAIAGLWKVFEKAGKPGWAAIVPFYNMFVVTEISGREILWFILLFVPCVGIVAAFLIWIDFAKAFGKDAVYGVLIALFPFIMLPIMGFSSSTRYQGGSRRH